MKPKCVDRDDEQGVMSLMPQQGRVEVVEMADYYRSVASLLLPQEGLIA